MLSSTAMLSLTEAATLPVQIDLVLLHVDLQLAEVLRAADAYCLTGQPALIYEFLTSSLQRMALTKAEMTRARWTLFKVPVRRAQTPQPWPLADWARVLRSEWTCVWTCVTESV